MADEQVNYNTEEQKPAADPNKAKLDAWRQGLGKMADQGDANVLNNPEFQSWNIGQALPSHYFDAGSQAANSGGGFNGGGFKDNLAQIQTGERNKTLYDQLLARAQQSTNIDRNDPAVRAQADAYAANEERSKRSYLDDEAERGGPLTNMRGERRMANERVGERTGSMEAQLMGRELMSRRNEIAQSLAQMGGMLSAEESLAAQQYLAQLDNAIKEKGLGVQQGQLDLGWGQLGLNAEQQASYWDWIRQGGTL